MSKPAIRVENLGKKYIIGHQKQENYTALRDVITNGVKSVAQKIINSQPTKDRHTEEFWALNDVSFEINQGDRVGIIGRNGAGKSTLLKILSRITEPTKGQIKIKGRVASLLEVGTGFHPELTGRENIFLNGAILGMSKAEIRKKFDEIVAFAEVEKFLDTPVKRYSSGMYVRLAFAVAAHLEPEILVVDEVLAVGDAQFQEKCLGKMDNVGKEGRTIIFVSHNMRAVQRLCTKSMLLEKGRSKGINSVSESINSYLLNSKKEQSIEDFIHLPRDSGLGKEARICNVTILDSNNEEIEEINFGQSFWIELECLGIQFAKKVQFLVGIDSINHGRITTLISQEKFDIRKSEIRKGRIFIDNFYLNPGTYMLTVGLRSMDRLIHIKQFKVNEFIYPADLMGLELDYYGCLQLPHAKWTLSEESNLQKIE